MGERELLTYEQFGSAVRELAQDIADSVSNFTLVSMNAFRCQWYCHPYQIELI